MNNAVLGKKHGKFEKTLIYQTCKNRRKKESISFRTKLLYNIFFLENSLAIEINRKLILINKIVLYEFW